MSIYHRVLGVSENATRAELKAAYRMLAHRYHPDISSEKNAKERFIEVVDAYRALTAEVALQDSTGFKKTSGKRRAFTTSRPNDANSRNEKIQENPHIDAENLNQSRKEYSASHTLNNECAIDVYVSVEELVWGVEVKVNPSTSCVGRRSIKGWRNSGLLNVKIPRGTRNGQRLRIAFQKSDARCAEADAIYLTVKLRPHPRYAVEGENLYVDMPVSQWEAEQGAVIDVITPSGRVDVDVPPGISSSQSVRIPGRGLPASRAEQGDLFAVARLVNLHSRTGKLCKWPNVPHVNSIRWRTVGNRHGSNVDVHV